MTAKLKDFLSRLQGASAFLYLLEAAMDKNETEPTSKCCEEKILVHSRDWGTWYQCSSCEKEVDPDTGEAA